MPVPLSLSQGYLGAISEQKAVTGSLVALARRKKKNKTKKNDK
jgi:hypothetical protein